MLDLDILSMFAISKITFFFFKVMSSFDNDQPQLLYLTSEDCLVRKSPAQNFAIHFDIASVQIFNLLQIKKKKHKSCFTFDLHFYLA